jgi:peptidoglycan/xylan/chitin deacetylase (PgdA/CDA1 family)
LSVGVPVFMYHWIDDALGDRLRLYGVKPKALRSQLGWLKQLGRKSIDLPALLGHVTGTSPAAPGSIVVTFDDGYVDNAEAALPLLQAAGMTATVFVVTDHAGGTNAWDAKHGDPPRTLLTWERMRALDGRGLRFEPHSRSHPELPKVSAERAREEIEGSKKRLEDELGREALAFSYPHGAFDERLEGMVRGAGFKLAVTDLGGLNRTGTDPLRIRRTMVTSRDVAPTYLFKAATGYGLMGWLSR